MNMKYFCKRYLILIFILISFFSCDRKKSNESFVEREQLEKYDNEELVNSYNEIEENVSHYLRRRMPDQFNEEANGNISYWISGSGGMPILVFEPYYFYEDEIVEYP